MTTRYCIAVVGKKTCGKSSLLRCYLKRNPAFSGATIGFDMLVADTSFILYDFSGDKKFSFMTESYLGKCAATILCYDVNDLDSLQYLAAFAHAPGPKLLVGLKSDLLSDVSEQSLHTFMQTYNIVEHCTCSTKLIQHKKFKKKLKKLKDEILEQDGFAVPNLGDGVLLVSEVEPQSRKLTVCDRLRVLFQKDKVEHSID